MAWIGNRRPSEPQISLFLTSPGSFSQPTGAVSLPSPPLLFSTGLSLPLFMYLIQGHSVFSSSLPSLAGFIFFPLDHFSAYFSQFCSLPVPLSPLSLTLGLCSSPVFSFFILSSLSSMLILSCFFLRCLGLSLRFFSARIFLFSSSPGSVPFPCGLAFLGHPPPHPSRQVNMLPYGSRGRSWAMGLGQPSSFFMHIEEMVMSVFALLHGNAAFPAAVQRG